MPVTIKGSGGGSVTLDAGAAATDTTLTLPNTTGTVALTASPTFSGTLTATTITSPASTALTIQSAGTTAMTVDTSQNVGIGTSSPSSRLQVSNGASGLAEIQLASNVQAFGIGTGGSTSGYGVSALYFYDKTANAERMRLSSSGNLLINRTTDTLGGSTRLALEQGSMGWTAFFKTNNSSGLGITNTSGTGSYTAIGFYNNGETYSSCGIVTVSGTTTTYGTSSDYRMKKNVAPITTGLATVAALKPVTYDWISTQEKGEGFIAHELAEVVPSAVIGGKDAVNEDGSIKPQNVDYSKIVVHLVAAIQELSAKNDALEARLAALEAK